MTYSSAPRLPGINLTVGERLPLIRLPSLAGKMLPPVDIVDEGTLAVCIYNPDAVNPFPLPPRGVDLPARMAMLAERGVTLFVISGLDLKRLASWMDNVGLDIYALSDADRNYAGEAGIPIKRVEGNNFRTHCAFILHEDRILAILPETDPVHHFEQLLAALDVAEGREPGNYELPDQPWYVRGRRPASQRGEIDTAEADEDDEDDERAERALDDENNDDEQAEDTPDPEAEESEA